MDQFESFDRLMNRLREGDGDAAEAVVQRLSSRLNRVARTHLETWVRRKVDPEDIIQSVFRSFFTRCEAGRFDLASWDELWGLLVVIAARKCVNSAEFFGAKCRNATAETAFLSWVDGVGQGERYPAVDPGPSPFEVAALRETVEQLLEGLDGEDRAAVELSLQGYTTREISERLGLAERTVRRLRERLRHRLERMQAEGTIEA
jgi:RNA polymerase sigma-70 factor (ECF subfamily)